MLPLLPSKRTHNIGLSHVNLIATRLRNPQIQEADQNKILVKNHIICNRCNGSKECFSDRCIYFRTCLACHTCKSDSIGIELPEH